MGTTYHNKPIVTDGLIFCVDPANKVSYPGSGTTVNDLIDNTTGTMSSTGMFDSVNAGVFAFDGAGDVITVPQNSSFNTISCTVSIWIKCSSLGSDDVIFANGTSGGNRTYWFYENNYVKWFYASTSCAEIDDSVIEDGNWHNIIGTYNGSSTLSVYHNGTLHDSVSCTSTRVGTNGLGINSYSNGGFGGNQKEMGPIQLYNRALSAQEVLQNYNALKNRFI